MRDYLMEKGIDRESIVMEDKSVNTDQNLKFSRRLIRGKASAGILSNNFHVFRAVQLAKYYEFEDVCGIAAKGDIPTAPNNFVREFFGVVKDLVIMRRVR